MGKKPDIWAVYSTFPNRDEALSAAASLLDRHLIACANVYDNVTSMYRWEGLLQTESEAIMIAKTQKTKVKKAVAAIKGLHSYQIPCILAYKAGDGFAPFLAWVAKESSQK